MNHLETRIGSIALWTAALLLVACGSSEPPTVSSELADTIAREYGSGVGAVGQDRNENVGSSSDLDPDTSGSEDPPDDNTPDPDENEPEDPPPMMPDPDPDPPPAGSFPDCDGFSIIEANCGQGGCHGGGSNLGNFAENEAAARSYIGRNGALTCASAGPIIDPENPSESVLVLKLSDDPPCGNYMPPSGQFLPADDVECITNWIANIE